jgi:protein translocase SecG subunit
MDLKAIISIGQLAISVVLIVLFLMQERGTGISEAFGGQQGGVNYQRRGAERMIFIVTVICIILFVATSIANLLLF